MKIQISRRHSSMLFIPTRIALNLNSHVKLMLPRLPIESTEKWLRSVCLYSGAFILKIMAATLIGKQMTSHQTRASSDSFPRSVIQSVLQVHFWGDMVLSEDSSLKCVKKDNQQSFVINNKGVSWNYVGCDFRSR